MDDNFLPFEDANISIASAPAQYGLSVYTALNIVPADDRELLGFRLEDHYRRLIDSADILGMHSFTDKVSYVQFVHVINELLNKNNIDEPVIVRINYYVNTIMKGTRIHDQPTGLSMFLLPFGSYYDKEVVDVCVSSWRRVSDESIPPRAKVTGSYVNASLMKSEAELNGYDDVIALNKEGHVAEGATANLFLVRNGKLITPPEDADILEGVTRRTVLAMAENLGIEVEIRMIDRTELYIADEMFFCGSSARISAIGSVDRRQVGDGKIGGVTKKIAKLYASVQSGDKIIDESWLTKFSKQGV